MKDKVLKLVQDALALAEDDLDRANVAFGGMTKKELEQEYGQSGRTCGEVLRGYQIKRDELEQCLNWVKNAT